MVVQDHEVAVHCVLDDTVLRPDDITSDGGVVERRVCTLCAIASHILCGHLFAIVTSPRPLLFRETYPHYVIQCRAACATSTHTLRFDAHHLAQTIQNNVDRSILVSLGISEYPNVVVYDHRSWCDLRTVACDVLLKRRPSEDVLSYPM